MSAVIVVLAGAGLSASADAQVRAPASVPIHFSRVPEVEVHLPQSSVYEIVESEEGFLWFATREGVGRWNGYDMDTWKHDPYSESTIPGNIVRQMVLDGAGDIWIDAENYQQVDAGIARIKAPAYNTVTRYDFTGGRLFLDGDRRLMVATADSVYALDSPTGKFNALFELNGLNGLPTAAAVDHHGLIWLSTEAGNIHRCDLQEKSCSRVPVETQVSDIVHFPESEIATVIQTTDGTVWISYGGNLGFIQEDSATIEWMDVSDAVKHSTLADIARDNEGNLWVLGSAGVNLLRSNKPPSVSEQYPLLTLGSDTENLAPVSLYQDRSGNIWVGTVYGLYRHSPYARQFHHLQHEPSNPSSLSSGLVVSLAEDAYGNIWAGTIGGGLNRIQSDLKTTRYRYRSGDESSLSNDIVWTLSSTSRGEIWAGTSLGINRYQEDTDDFKRFYADPDDIDLIPDLAAPTLNSIVGMAMDGEDRLWFSDLISSGVLTYLDTKTEEFSTVDLQEPVDPGYFMIDEDNNVWFGSSTGIYKLKWLENELELIARSPGAGSFDGILAFHQADDGTVWVGTNSGLYGLTDGGEIHTRITSTEGLPSSTVYSVLDDDYGRLWVSTNRGIASLDFTTTDSLPRISSFDHTNGIRNTEFNRKAYLKARDGTLYFGGDTGITYFNPEDILPNTYMPPVVITAVERATRSGGSRLPFITATESLRIRPDEVTFAFEFAAISYVNTNRNKYAVMLEGWDESWIDIGEERRVSYSNIPPGNYTFKVIGSNEDGVWNHEGAEVDVIVEPTFWQTWWFKALLTILIASLFVIATWVIFRQRYQRELTAVKAQRALERERNRISRDMHDEVGANLTEISILSELALLQGGDGSETYSLLNRIAGKSRDMLDSIGEIIWAINPHNDTAQRFTPYLREFAADYCENVGLNYQLDFPLPASSVQVTSEFRRNVFLILKEALANAARHANAKTVWITLLYADDDLELRISDDGTGHPAAGTQENGSGNGIRNMMDRAKEIGGSLSITDRSEHGGMGLVLKAPLPMSSTVSVEN